MCSLLLHVTTIKRCITFILIGHQHHHHHLTKYQLPYNLTCINGIHVSSINRIYILSVKMSLDFKYSVRVLSAGVVVFMVLIVVCITLMLYCFKFTISQLTFEQVNLLVIVSNLIEVAYEGSSFEEENQDLVNAVVGLACMFYNNKMNTMAVTHVISYRFLLYFLSTCKLIYSDDIISHISSCIQVCLE